MCIRMNTFVLLYLLYMYETALKAMALLLKGNNCGFSD